jgi:hypothetical protein
MMRSIRLMGVLVAGALLTVAGQASAQGQAPLERGFMHVNFGAQGGSHDLVQSGAFPVYDEEALLTGKTDVGGGPVFDVGGGYRLFGKLYGGLSYSWMGDKSNADITGSVPHPFYYDQFRAVTGTATGLEHTESALHIQGIWRQPITTKFDVALSFGPTIFWVSQDLVSGLTLAEQGTPTTGVVLTGVQTEQASETAVGFNIGADGTYMFSRRLGAGAFLRYTGGSVDLDSAGGSVKLDLGGVQIGAGLRLRF